MDWGTILLILDYVVKFVAIGLIPENRHPSSSLAWLLVVLLVPVVGLPLFLLLGSPYVRGRRHRTRARSNELLSARFIDDPLLPDGIEVEPDLHSLVRLNRTLTALPAVLGDHQGIEADYVGSIHRMAEAVDEATRTVHVEIYAVARDRTTEVFFTALERAVSRGVTVRLLLDQIGSSKYPGYRAMLRSMTAAGIEWRLMMPLQPLKGRWRRPDLRNHRKLVTVDSMVGFMGSQNMIDSTYLMRKNVRVGRHWHDTTIRLTGPIVDQLEAVFEADWFAESGERLHLERGSGPAPAAVGGATNLFQLIPSGPGYTTTPNLRLFTSLMEQANEKLFVVSPYFVPDEALLQTITTAAYRGVRVELYVSEQADQFMVDHAQASYYRALLESGVRIYRLPRPAVLHSKLFVVDDQMAVFGSSNLDMRSFELDYEITLLGTGGDFVAEIHAVIAAYRAACVELTREQWEGRSWGARYVDNVMRLTSALQ
ncbi:MAG: phospholipase D-like domain-containing protein [Propioniciclava sp.]